PSYLTQISKSPFVTVNYSAIWCTKPSKRPPNPTTLDDLHQPHASPCFKNRQKLRLFRRPSYSKRENVGKLARLFNLARQCLKNCLHISPKASTDSGAEQIDRRNPRLLLESDEFLDEDRQSL